MVRDILWKADNHSAFQKIACFLYGTRRFITVFTRVRHWTLSWASRIQFATSVPISLRSIVSPVVSSLRVPQPKPCKHLSHPHACYMSRLSHPPWFSHPNNISWRIQALKFIIMHFSPLSVFLPFRSKYHQHSVLKSSVYVSLSKRETKFRTHTAQPAKLQFYIV
jgi:hypothetical protein